MKRLEFPSAILSALRSRLPEHDDHWQALITEQAVKERFKADGLHLASFSGSVRLIFCGAGGGRAA